MFLTFVFVWVALVAGSFACTGPTNYTINLRTLVVYDNAQDLMIPRLVLEGFNTQWVQVASTQLRALDQPNFNSIIITGTRLNATGWQEIRNYSKKYCVRIVHLHPAVESVPGSAYKRAPNDANYIVFDDTARAVATGDILNTKYGWEVASNLQPWTVSQLAGDSVPLLRYSAQPQRSNIGDVAAFTTTAHGMEEMYFLFNAALHEMQYDAFTGRDNPAYVRYHHFTESNLAFGTMWFTWATKGIFIGLRRLHLQAHIDDYLIASPMHESSAIFRVDGRSCEGNVRLSKEITAALPTGSRFVFENAVNGIGYQQNGYEQLKLGPGLVNCTVRNLNNYHWVSHTYSHKDFDWVDANLCNGEESKCLETYERIKQEIDLNAALLRGDYVDPRVVPSFGNASPIQPGAMFAGNVQAMEKFFSPLSMVPPEISGLVPSDFPQRPGVTLAHRVYGRPHNVNATAALWNSGIKYVTGDSTRAELVARNNHHGLYTTRQGWGVDGLLILNRRASAIDFMSENAERFTQAAVSQNYCQRVGGKPCDSFLPTFENIMQREVDSHVAYFLQYNVDPVMFHQINLNIFSYRGREVSLVGLWAEMLSKRIMEYFTGLPIVSLKMDDLGRFVEQRMKRDSCGIGAQLVMINGIANHIVVSSKQSCHALVSFVSSSAPAVPIPGLYNATELYGNDRTVTVPVSPISTATIPLVTVPVSNQ